MLKIKGDVKVEGNEAEYVGMGSYGYVFDQPITGDKTITVETKTGDKASYTLSPVPAIEIISINGDSTFPIIDLKTKNIAEFDYEFSNKNDDFFDELPSEIQDKLLKSIKQADNGELIPFDEVMKELV